MSWNSLALGLFVLNLSGTQAASQSMICPPTLNGRILLDVALYDGPITGLGEMLPVGGIWSLGHPPRSPAGFHISCRYQGVKDALAVRLPDGIRSCRYVAPDREGEAANVRCE
jgi:hypothetical protein